MMFHTSETVLRPDWGKVAKFGGGLLFVGVMSLVWATPAPIESLAVPPDTATVLPAKEPLALPPEDFKAHCDWVLPPTDFSHTVHRVAAEANLNPRVLALTVYRESKCRADAKGRVGEIGLGQIYPAVWETTLKEEGLITSVDDLYDPEVNLRATAFVLNDAYKTSQGKPVAALRIYNGRGKRAVRYAAQQRDRYHALWGEEVFFRPRPLEAVRPGVTEQPDL
jgi:hypothetical protein